MQPRIEELIEQCSDEDVVTVMMVYDRPEGYESHEITADAVKKNLKAIGDFVDRTHMHSGSASRVAVLINGQMVLAGTNNVSNVNYAGTA